jgi:chromosome segregation protein
MSTQASQKLTLTARRSSDLRTRAGGARHRVLAIRGRAHRRRGDTDLGDEMVRVEQLRERARGRSAVERRRSMERDRRAADGQRFVVANLEADAQRLRDELAGVEADLLAAGSTARSFAADEAVVIAAEQARDEQRGAFDADLGAEQHDRRLLGARLRKIRGELAFRARQRRNARHRSGPRRTAQRDAAVAKAASVSEERERMVVEHRDRRRRASNG